MARPRGLIRRSAPQRRRTGWNDGPGGTAPASISVAGATILGAGVVALQDGLTVARIRGELAIHLSLATASGDGFAGAVAIGGPVSQNAFIDIGVTAVPHPVADADWEGWLWHRFFSVKSPVAFSAGAAQNGSDIASSLRVEVDSKAMRKFGEDEAIFAIVEVAEAGTATVNVAFNSRMLIFLP